MRNGCWVSRIAGVALVALTAAAGAQQEAASTPSPMVSQAHKLWLSLPNSTANALAVQSIQLVAPVNGYALITATGTYEYTHVFGTAGNYCLDLSEVANDIHACVPDTGTTAVVRGAIPAGEATGKVGYGASIPYSSVSVVPVTEGKSYTIYLNGYSVGMVESGSWLFQPTITAVFVASK